MLPLGFAEPLLQLVFKEVHNKERFHGSILALLDCTDVYSAHGTAGGICKSLDSVSSHSEDFRM